MLGGRVQLSAIRHDEMPCSDRSCQGSEGQRREVAAGLGAQDL
jgi:hypothetical protein